MKKIFPVIITLFLFASCGKEEKPTNIFQENFVELTSHHLKSYSVESNSEYLVVCESGLGDDHSVWLSKNLANDISKQMDILLYDRAGYGNSTIDNNPRNIDRLRIELEALVDQFSKGRKVILVGHSLGGLIIRDYAIKNPNKTAALLFIDPSHEYYNEPSQELEDLLYTSFSDAYGPDFGGTKEVRELIEDLEYTSLLPNLPDVPVTVLTSMKNDQANIAADEANNKTRQDWYDAHELLQNGVSDFTHIQTTNSGHYIMNNEASLVIENLHLLISKLP
ncbi:MAG: alpha/beta fold hydrolase [Chitinophagales bacterium]